MVLPSYDIEAVKKYFFYYVYRRQTSRLTEEQYIRYTTRPYFLLSEKIGGILILMLMGIFTFLFAYQVFSFGMLGWEYLTFDSLFGPILFLPFVLGFAWLGRMMYKRSRRLESLGEYFKLKTVNEELLGNFEKVAQKDAQEVGINPIEIESIQKILSNIEKTSKIILGPLIEFRKIKKELKEEQVDVLEKFIEIEGSWLIDYIRRFQSILSNWIETHTKELEGLKDSLEKSNIKEFTLAIGQLDVQKEALEKVKVSL